MLHIHFLPKKNFSNPATSSCSLSELENAIVALPHTVLSALVSVKVRGDGRVRRELRLSSEGGSPVERGPGVT